MSTSAERMKEGEVVEGTVSDLDTVWSDWQNTNVPLVVIRQGNGEERRLIAFHEVLQRELAKRRPRVGDRIKVTCHGEKATKDGKRTATLYTVEGGQEVNADTFWSGFGSRNDPDRSKANTNAEDDSDIPF